MQWSWFGDFFTTLDDALVALWEFGDPSGRGQGWWGIVILLIWGILLIAVPLAVDQTTAAVDVPLNDELTDLLIERFVQQTRLALARLMAARRGEPPDDFAFFAPRAPIKPVRIADILA